MSLGGGGSDPRTMGWPPPGLGNLYLKLTLTPVWQTLSQFVPTVHKTLLHAQQSIKRTKPTRDEATLSPTTNTQSGLCLAVFLLSLPVTLTLISSFTLSEAVSIKNATRRMSLEPTIAQTSLYAVHILCTVQSREETQVSPMYVYSARVNVKILRVAKLYLALITASAVFFATIRQKRSLFSYKQKIAQFN